MHVAVTQCRGSLDLTTDLQSIYLAGVGTVTSRKPIKPLACFGLGPLNKPDKVVSIY